MTNKTTLIIAFFLLITMAFLMIGSVRNDSYLGDESAHIASGYSYLTQKTMRLNIEHPPLFKSWAAFPLIFLNLEMPYVSNYSSYQVADKWHGAQWTLGIQFLFNQKESVEKILFLSRLMMIILTLFLGFLVFKWTKNYFNNYAGLLSLFLFVLSPTMISNGRYVTNDIAAALGAFVAVYFFVKFIHQPSFKNIFISGLALGFAQLLKFSLMLLFPFFVFLAFIWVILNRNSLKSIFFDFINFLPKLGIIFLISLILISLVYSFHLFNYPKNQHIEDMQSNLYQSGLNNGDFLLNLANWKITRPISHYVLGVLKVSESTGGRFSYFLGEGSTTGWRFYFPVAYLVKEPISTHILLLISFLYLLWIIKKSNNFIEWARQNFFILTSVLWVAFYLFFVVFIISTNLGLRHLSPIYPFLFFLIGGTINLWVISNKKKYYLKISLIVFLVAFQFVSVVKIYPSFLSYFNELIGGPDNGHKYLVDSNLDWGQDAKRLSLWVEEQEIKKIKIPRVFSVMYQDTLKVNELPYYNYSYEYYLGDKYEYLPPAIPTTGWIAVPATLLQWGRANPASKNGWSSNSYRWLNAYKPVAKIGYSIFVYYIDDVKPGEKINIQENLKTAFLLADAYPNSDNLVNLGFWKIKNNQYQEAILVNEKVIEINNLNVVAYNNLGWAYMKLGMRDKAIESFKKALEINPDFDLAKRNLETIYDSLSF